MADPVPPPAPCPGGCRELADPEKAEEMVLRLLPLCRPAFAYWLRTDGIRQIVSGHEMLVGHGYAGPKGPPGSQAVRKA